MQETNETVIEDSFVDNDKQAEIAKALEKLHLLRARAEMLAQAKIKPNRKQRRAAAVIARREARRAMKKAQGKK
jgi:hypothetical protein